MVIHILKVNYAIIWNRIKKFLFHEVNDTVYKSIPNIIS
jgi:hypothetical protein